MTSRFVSLGELLKIHAANGGSYRYCRLGDSAVYVVSGFHQPHYLFDHFGLAYCTYPNGKTHPVTSYETLALAAFQDWLRLDDPSAQIHPVWIDTWKQLGLLRQNS